jgi:hypothetical protein
MTNSSMKSMTLFGARPAKQTPAHMSRALRAHANERSNRTAQPNAISADRM